MFSIEAIKSIIEKKFNAFFTRLYRGGEMRAYKIKPVLFLYTLGFLAATKTLQKRKRRKTIVNYFNTRRISNSFLNSTHFQKLLVYIIFHLEYAYQNKNYKNNNIKSEIQIRIE